MRAAIRLAAPADQQAQLDDWLARPSNGRRAVVAESGLMPLEAPDSVPLARLGYADTESLVAALADGSALDAWQRMVIAHGGDPDPDRLETPIETVDVAAATGGFVVGCDGEELGRVAATVGAGRRRVEEEIAHGAGMVVHARIGDRIEKHQPLATLLVGTRAIDRPQMVERIRNAFVIGPDAVAPPRLILGTVDEV